MEWSKAFRSMGTLLWAGAILAMATAFGEDKPENAWVVYMLLLGVALHLFGLFGQPKNKD